MLVKSASANYWKLWCQDRNKKTPVFGSEDNTELLEKGLMHFENSEVFTVIQELTQFDYPITPDLQMIDNMGEELVYTDGLIEINGQRDRTETNLSHSTLNFF